MMDDLLQFHIAPDQPHSKCSFPIAKRNQVQKYPNKISWSRYEVNNTQVPYKLLNCAWHSKPCALRAVEVHPGKKCSSECKLGGESSIRYIHIHSHQKWPTFKIGPLVFLIWTAFEGTVVKSLRGMTVRMSIFPDGFAKLSRKFHRLWNVHWRTVNQSKE